MQSLQEKCSLKLATRIEKLNQEQFETLYNLETECFDVLFRYHWPDGFCCSECQGTENYKITTGGSVKCKKCNQSKALRSGTPLSMSRTSLTDWFYAFYLWIKSKPVRTKTLRSHAKLRSSIRKLRASFLVEKLEIDPKTADKMLECFSKESGFWLNLSISRAHEKIMFTMIKTRSGKKYYPDNDNQYKNRPRCNKDKSGLVQKNKKRQDALLERKTQGLTT